MRESLNWRPDFEQLVDEHQSMVFSLAWRLIGDRGLAEEVAQDVLLELDRNLHKLQSAEHVKFWLRRVTVNRSTDALRRRTVREPGWGEGYWVPLEEWHGLADEDVESSLSVRIEELLSALPESQRAALVLRYQEDLMPEEIAEVLEMPVRTVKSHLQRSLAILREKIERSLGDIR